MRTFLFIRMTLELDFELHHLGDTDCLANIHLTIVKDCAAPCGSSLVSFSR